MPKRSDFTLRDLRVVLRNIVIFERMEVSVALSLAAHRNQPHKHGRRQYRKNA